jgi:hypothetical protein
MWHLFKNNQQLFEFAFINKGNYIAGTRQGYENRSGALKSLNTLVRKPSLGMYFAGILVQDDTGEKSQVIALYKDNKQVLTNNKPGKRYKP